MISNYTNCLVLLLAIAFNPSAANARQRADMSRLVVLGDSLMAGYQNGSLMASQQTNGIAALIARQARTVLELPLIAEPGIPNVLNLVDPGPPPNIVRAPGTSAGRLNPVTQVNNLAVPGHRVIDALRARPEFPIDSMTDLVLGLPGLLNGISRSQVEWAEALQPTTIVVWLGNNDALNAAVFGDTVALTSGSDFEAAYSELMDRLAATGATIVVANIPDVSVIPLVVPVEQAAAFFDAPLPAFTGMLGISAEDYLTLDNVGLVTAVLQGAVPGPLGDNAVLDAGEIEEIRQATAAFNDVIAQQAAAHGAVLIDVNSFLYELAANGITVGGERLTTDFLGGIFSLDGVHPTNAGAAVTANFFIKTLNREVSAGIPPISVRQVQRYDFVPTAARDQGHTPVKRR